MHIINEGSSVQLRCISLNNYWNVCSRRLSKICANNFEYHWNIHITVSLETGHVPTNKNIVKLIEVLQVVINLASLFSVCVSHSGIWHNRLQYPVNICPWGWLEVVRKYLPSLSKFMTRILLIVSSPVEFHTAVF